MAIKFYHSNKVFNNISRQAMIQALCVLVECEGREGRLVCIENKDMKSAT